MFLKRITGHRLVVDALKRVGSDFQRIAKQSTDADTLEAETERLEHFAQDLLFRVQGGEMDEKYAQTPGALEKLFKQVMHASLLASCLRLFVAYERGRTRIYGSGG